MHQSFVNYRHFRYAIAAGLLAAAALCWYLLDRPRVPANGATWLGYTLGSVAALLVVLLSLLGIRKRRFHSRLGTATGWLSAHVYLGLAALLLATLHSGPHLGRNVPTAAYLLMCVVTLSGCWGAYAYVRYPGLISRQRGAPHRRTLLQQVSEIDQRLLDLAGASPAVNNLVTESVRRTDIGGEGLWQRLRSRDQSMLVVGAESALRPARLATNAGQAPLIGYLAHAKLTAPDDVVRQHMQGLLDLAGSKAVLLQRLRWETRTAALLRGWLYVHVPLCCALLAALVAHVTSVFLYW